MSAERARRYVAWLDRHTSAIFALTALAVTLAIVLVATRLPIRADFSYLLPQDADSVRDLRKLEQRMPAKDTTLILLVATDPAMGRQAKQMLVDRLRAIGAPEIERLETDDAPARAIIRAHRWLYVPLADLALAREALARRIKNAKRDANPLFVDLDPPSGDDELAELRSKRHDAERLLDRSGYISADEHTQLVIVRTAFRATDVPRDRALLAAFDAVFSRVRAAYPGVQLGLAGGVPTAIAEHDAVARGMVLSTIVTSVLVALVLFVHLRRVAFVALVTLQIIVATVLSFGLAAITVGHLNAATAFLGAIIAGNGVNYGILLVARYIEERETTPAAESLARAIAATARPTLVAALGASIAYGALAVTRFKGFSDFAIIGGLGMIACWIVAYVLFPALLLRFGDVRLPGHAALFGKLVERTVGSRRPWLVLAIAGVVTVAAGLVTFRFVARDPFEYDLSRIRSDAPAAVEARRWLAISNAAFGRGAVGRSYLAVDRVEQVAELVATLRDVKAHLPEGRATIGLIESIVDIVPTDQPRKLEVLDQIRALLDDPALDALDDAQRDELRELRPPDDLRSISVEDLPGELVEPFRERDGRIGLIVAVRPAEAFDDLDGRAMIKFAAAIRAVRLREPIIASGSSLVFADILAVNRADIPLVTGVAALGLIVMVIFVVGRNRRAVAVLVATATGSLAMVATCALCGLRINFLDFVALPIALGLGVDYAVNVAERVVTDPALALRTTGGSVLVCSLTTMIGYASLLVSDNHGIREFGVASLIGEITCVVAALTVVPALLVRRV